MVQGQAPEPPIGQPADRRTAPSAIARVLQRRYPAPLDLILRYKVYLVIMSMTIGKVARKVGVNVQTLRYYERIGLMKPSGRGESGYRFYPSDAVQRLSFIKHAQQLGFSLADIGALLELRVSDPSHCLEVHRKAEVRLEDVRTRIERLRRMEQVLEELIRSCAERLETDPCPILQSLQAGGSRFGLEAERNPGEERLL